MSVLDMICAVLTLLLSDMICFGLLILSSIGLSMKSKKLDSARQLTKQVDNVS